MRTTPLLLALRRWAPGCRQSGPAVVCSGYCMPRCSSSPRASSFSSSMASSTLADRLAPISRAVDDDALLFDDLLDPMTLGANDDLNLAPAADTATVVASAPDDDVLDDYDGVDPHASTSSFENSNDCGDDGSTMHPAAASTPTASLETTELPNDACTAGAEDEGPLLEDDDDPSGLDDEGNGGNGAPFMAARQKTFNGSAPDNAQSGSPSDPKVSCARVGATEAAEMESVGLTMTP